MCRCTPCSLSCPDLGADQLDQAPELRRVGITGGIRQADLVTAQFNQFYSNFDDLLLRNSAFERAAEGRGQAALEVRPLVRRQRLQQRLDIAHLVVDLLVGLVQVGLAVSLADRQGQGDLVRAGLDRIFGALEIGHQRGHRQARQGAGIRHNFGGISQLWQQFGRHERAHLDFRHAGLGFGLDPGFLGLGRHDGLDALQAVARADFTDQNVDRTHDVVLG